MPKMTSDEYYSKESILEIKNQKFILTLKYGAFSILNPISYSLLSISNLYGTYTYMNQSLILSGINITLTKDYDYMSSLRIGNTSKLSQPIMLKSNAVNFDDVFSKDE